MFASFQNRWLIVIASIFALMAVAGTINTFAFAVFLKPVSADLGIGRSAMASGLLVAMTVCGVITPFVGLLVDRWGCRNILLPGIPLFALSVAALAWLQASPVLMYALFAVVGLFGAGQNTVPYATVISKWFDRERGLALGITMTGYGLGIVVVPQVASLMIATAGWRMAYAGLGALVMLLAFVPVLLLVREPAAADLQPGERRGSEVPGLTARQVFTGQWRFWVMGGGFCLATISTHGTLAHMVAMLTDRGMPELQATAALSATGFGAIAGRIGCGLCLDRFHGPGVAASFFITTALGICCLASGAAGVVPMLGALLCGIGLGAQVGIMALFASRYFGLKAYGAVFGAMFGMLLIGNGVGPFLGGLSFDLLHSYRPAMVAFGICLIGVSLLFIPLGPYPFGARDAAVPIRRPPSVEPAESIGTGVPVAATT
jgi:MFS family permease